MYFLRNLVVIVMLGLFAVNSALAGPANKIISDWLQDAPKEASEEGEEEEGGEE